MHGAQNSHRCCGVLCVPGSVQNLEKRKKLALAAAGVAGSITNTILVMNLIYFLFGSTYAEAAQANVEHGLYLFIVGVICLNGIPEAVLAGFLTALIVSALWKVQRA